MTAEEKQMCLEIMTWYSLPDDTIYRSDVYQSREHLKDLADILRMEIRGNFAPGGMNKELYQLEIVLRT